MTRERLEGIKDDLIDIKSIKEWRKKKTAKNDQMREFNPLELPHA